MATNGPRKSKTSPGETKTESRSPKAGVEPEVVHRAAEKIWVSLDQETSFADFEEVALEAGNELIRHLLKKTPRHSADVDGRANTDQR